MGLCARDVSRRAMQPIFAVIWFPRTQRWQRRSWHHIYFSEFCPMFLFLFLCLCVQPALASRSPHSLPRGREGHVFFKLSVSSVTVSISGLTPLCFFHEGLAFTLSLIMLSYDNGIKRKNTESCPSGVLYACPNKQLVLGIVLQLPCPQPHPFYAVLMMNFNHGAVWPRQPSPDQQPSTVKGSLCYCGVSRVKSFFREHTEKPDGFCLHFHL